MSNTPIKLIFFIFSKLLIKLIYNASTIFVWSVPGPTKVKRAFNTEIKFKFKIRNQFFFVFQLIIKYFILYDERVLYLCLQ